MSNYVCTDGKPWQTERVTVNVKGTNKEKNVPLRDERNQRIPLYTNGSWGRWFSDPFRHISEYSPVVYNVLTQLADIKQNHPDHPITKEELIQVIKDAYFEAQQIFVHSTTNHQTDVKGSEIFDRLLVALTLTNKVNPLAQAPEKKNDLEEALSYLDGDLEEPNQGYGHL
jgi:hypothetical protein